MILRQRRDQSKLFSNRQTFSVWISDDGTGDVLPATRVLAARKIRFSQFPPSILVVIGILALVLLISSCSYQQPSYPGNTEGFWYTFQQGDTLEKIGKEYNISRFELQRINDIYDPKDLTPGMEIFIPSMTKIQIESEAPAEVIRQSRMIWPAAGTISSGFGKRHGRYHQGIDITQDNGRNVVAAASGTVEFVGRKSGYGNTIIINHGSGLKTLYAHNAKIYVSKGRTVKQGTVISLMGSTGKSTGIHLHFEVRYKGRPQNPLRYLPVR